MPQNADVILSSTAEITIPEPRKEGIRLLAAIAGDGRDLDFGEHLRRERILRGISKDEVVRVTKVTREYVTALEKNRFDELPPPAFVKGFLRVLARFAGLDGDDLICRYMAELERTETAGEIVPEPPRFWRRYRNLVLTLCGLVCLVSLMFAPLLGR